MIDNAGEVVHKWDLPYRVGRYARILPNGNLLVGMKDPQSPVPFPFVSYHSLVWCFILILAAGL